MNEIEVIINGEAKVTTMQNLADILATIGIDTGVQGVAVAVNGEIVYKKNWANHSINNNDEIEIITAMQGG